MATSGDSGRMPADDPAAGGDTVHDTVSPPGGPETPEQASADHGEVGGLAPHEDPKGWGIATITVVTLGAICVVLWGISEHADMLMPAFLALNLVIAAQPLQQYLERVGLPRWGAMIVVLLVLYLLLLALVGMLVWALWVAAAEIPQYQDKFVSMYKQSIEFLGRLGVDQNQVSESLHGISPGTVIGTLQNVAGQVTDAGGQLTVLVIALTFLVFDVPGIFRRRATIARLRPRLAD